MAYEDSFGFTHLVEDSDDDDNALDLSNSHLDVDLQPHLGSLETATSITGHSSQEDDDDTRPRYPNDAQITPRSYTSTSSNGHAYGYAEENASPKKTVSVGDIASIDDSAPVSMSSVTSAAGGDVGDRPAHNGSVTSAENGTTGSSGGATAAPTQSNISVQFSNAKGQVQVVQQPIGTRPDGSYYINTHGVPVQYSEPERPLTKKRILGIKIFSVIAAIFFFPSGIPAVCYAFSIDKVFNEGIMQGNIDKAQKYAKRSERLIILSLVLSVVFATLIVALVERPHHDEHTSQYNGAIVG